MEQTEPPSCSSNVILVGRNSRGNWVAQEEHGLFGGLFINRAEAVKYALFDNGRHPEDIVTVAAPLELKMGLNTMSGDREKQAEESSFQRHAA